MLPAGVNPDRKILDLQAEGRAGGYTPPYIKYSLTRSRGQNKHIYKTD